ncbi:hypothetical protein ElyMa_005800500 [Elysia marginata]|uniref:Uncharacterized protein n=1 Tax=Elysia marginata TaxID=1093978 RepID=A0AAV4FSP7_9GAST|nr:hypothetical protein ElyMa_005800500 [Elysia marginata]
MFATKCFIATSLVQTHQTGNIGSAVDSNDPPEVTLVSLSAQARVISHNLDRHLGALSAIPAVISAKASFGECRLAL